MRIITINVNGIRSALKKGLFDWLSTINPDIICFQEIKASLEDIPTSLLNWHGYHTHFFSAEKKGYSGVAIFSKMKPNKIIQGLDDDIFDGEGRYLQFDFDNFSVVSLYMPSGSSGPEMQMKKFTCMDVYQKILQEKIKSNREYIICGDWNIAHQPIDLKNWRGNMKNSGFLPSEREWLSNVLNMGFVDTWRTLYPDIPGYTWWSNRGAAYTKDVGWRIDYQIATANIGKQITSAQIFKDIKFSDHAPLIVDYDSILYSLGIWCRYL